MPYGTPKSTGPWRMTIQLRYEPRCPGCAEFLQPVVVEVRDGWAWCHVCIARKLNREVHLAWVVQQEPMCQCSTILNGIRFYTPDATAGKALSAYEWYEKAIRDLNPSSAGTDRIPDLPVVQGSPEGLYLLVPADEVAWTDRPVIDDAAWNAHCLAKRKAIASPGEDQPEDVCELTPSGERLLTDLDLNGLENVQLDAKRVRPDHCSHPCGPNARG